MAPLLMKTARQLRSPPEAGMAQRDAFAEAS
jgi:hypothetical protein